MILGDLFNLEKELERLHGSILAINEAVIHEDIPNIKSTVRFYLSICEKQLEYVSKAQLAEQEGKEEELSRYLDLIEKLAVMVKDDSGILLSKNNPITASISYH